MDLSTIVIETKNLIIKSITLDYKQDICDEFTSEITKYMFPQPAKKIEETVEFIEKSMKENKKGKNLQTVILDKHNNEFLGCAGLHQPETKIPKFGIWLKKSAHGKRYGQEAITALKHFADKNINYDYIIYNVAEENIASKKIPELLGGKLYRKYNKTNLSGNAYLCIEYRIYPDLKK